MCGIVGYVGQRPVQEVLLAGPGEARVPRLRLRGHLGPVGRAARLRARGRQPAARCAPPSSARASDGDGGVAVLAPPATTGIGHTRWATHGRVTEENAHPHFDDDDRVHVVVNGIVENYMELKQELLDRRRRASPRRPTSRSSPT